MVKYSFNKNATKNLVNMQASWPHAWSITQYCYVSDQFMDNSSTQNLNQTVTTEDGISPCFYSGISESLQSDYFYNTKLIFTPVTILLGLWCFLSNGLVLFVVLRSSFRKRAAFLMLCSLTLSDFLWGGVVTPMYIFFRVEEFMRGRICGYDNDLNNYWYYIPLHLCLLGTIGNLAVISVDRYLAVAKAMWYKVSVKQRHAFVACACIWLFAILLLTFKLIAVFPYKWIQIFEWCFMALVSATVVTVQLITMRFLWKHNSNVAEMTANTANAATAAM